MGTWSRWLANDCNPLRLAKPARCALIPNLAAADNYLPCSVLRPLGGLGAPTKWHPGFHDVLHALGRARDLPRTPRLVVGQGHQGGECDGGVDNRSLGDTNRMA